MSAPETADVIVIGAGIVGAACTLELAEAGLRVAVVTAGQVGEGATSAGMGHLVTLDGSAELFALVRLSMDLWRQRAGELPASCGASFCGTLWLAEDAGARAELEVKASCYRRWGVAHEHLDAVQLAEAEPRLHPGLAAGLRVPGDGMVLPPAVAAEWVARACREHGARLLAATPVRAVDAGPMQARVELADGRRLHAERVVIATGCDALALLPVPLPQLTVRPRKGHLLITESHPGFCRHQLAEAGYTRATVDATDAVTFNLQPRRNGQLVLGSSRQLGNTSPEVDAAVLERILRRALDFVPGLAALPVERAWTGVRAASSDHLPILGPVPERPRLLLATGHEGLGLTTSLGSARLIADEILDRPSPIPRAPYRPDRNV